MTSFRYEAVDQTNWMDVEKLFESRGAPSNCWCMVWRKMQKGTDRSKKQDKKLSLKSYVDKKTVVGLLCYDGKEPIAWCSIAPRDSYRELHGVTTISKVWSIVCFYIKRTYRNKGLSKELIRKAEAYAKENNADYIEAYPVDPESPSYRFMGFKPTFEAANFEFKHMAGSRRNVMIKKL